MGFLVWMLHILVAAALVGLVLLQHGKGADMGAAFGSGSSGSLFGASGSANFLSRTTAVLATVFFLTSMGLTFFSSKARQPVQNPLVEQTVPSVPVVPSQSQEGANKSGDIPK